MNEKQTYVFKILQSVLLLITKERDISTVFHFLHLGEIGKCFIVIDTGNCINLKNIRD